MNDQKLRCRWSKKEDDVLIFYPCKQDGALLHYFLQNAPFDRINKKYGKTFLQDLKDRGYDVTTLKFEVTRKKEEFKTEEETRKVYPKVLVEMFLKDAQYNKRLWWLVNDKGDYLDDFTKCFFGDGQTAHYDILVDENSFARPLNENEQRELEEGNLAALYQLP